MSYIQVRIDPRKKSQAQKVLRELGIDMSTAVKIYLSQIIINKGIPFKLITENSLTPEQEKEILTASKEAERGVNVSKAMDIKEAVSYLKDL